MSGKISTHVLDTSKGKPASDLPVRLERQEAADHWRLLASALTDQDGRCGQLLPEDEGLRAGNYRLSFEVGDYFAAQKITGIVSLGTNRIFREGRRGAISHSLAAGSIRVHDVPRELIR